MIQREILACLFSTGAFACVPCKEAVACFLCEAANRFSVMRSTLLKAWIITQFIVAEEAHTGKQQNPSAAASASACHISFDDICFLIKNFSKDVSLQHTHTRAHTLGICDYCQEKISFLLKYSWSKLFILIKLIFGGTGETQIDDYDSCKSIMVRNKVSVLF